MIVIKVVAISPLVCKLVEHVASCKFVFELVASLTMIHLLGRGGAHSYELRLHQHWEVGRLNPAAFKRCEVVVHLWEAFAGLTLH